MKWKPSKPSKHLITNRPRPFFLRKSVTNSFSRRPRQPLRSTLQSSRPTCRSGESRPMRTCALKRSSLRSSRPPMQPCRKREIAWSQRMACLEGLKKRDEGARAKMWRESLRKTASLLRGLRRWSLRGRERLSIGSVRGLLWGKWSSSWKMIR